MNPEFELTTTPQPLVELVDVVPSEQPRVSAAIAKQIEIDVIHDGRYIPADFLINRSGDPITFEQLEADYVRERDWGASAVASRLAHSLGLRRFARISLARVLMDFGRFPGSTPKHADHLHRFAINYPFSSWLSYSQKKRLLEDYYDSVSAALESALRGAHIKIAIHTYDQYNVSGTERPAVSLMTRSIGYQTSSELPSGLFDPLYPDILAEFTADRILRDRISLTLEKRHIPVAHNYPYCLPEGSLEVRYQVWAYFNALRQAFEEENPESGADPAFGMVWEMLFDTNLRSSDSDALRSFLHMYRRAPVGRELEFQRAAHAYEALGRFCEGRGDAILNRYRFDPARTSSLAIEVRKDLACELGPDGKPIRIRHDVVNMIADAIADAIGIYFAHDRAETEVKTPDEDVPEELERHTPWYTPPR